MTHIPVRLLRRSEVHCRSSAVYNADDQRVPVDACTESIITVRTGGHLAMWLTLFPPRGPLRGLLRWEPIDRLLWCATRQLWRCSE